MCRYFDLLLYSKQDSILLLILSVFNKLSTLSAPSTINLFLQISTCLIWPNWYCSIHLSKRLWLLHPNCNLSNMTKLIFLDSLLQEVRVTGIQIKTWLIWPSLYCLIYFSKRCVSSDNSEFFISWISWNLCSLLGFESSWMGMRRRKRGGGVEGEKEDKEEG